MATETATKTGVRERYDHVKSIAKEHRFSYLFIGPTTLFLLIVLWMPFLRGVLMSFYNWPLIGEKEFVGLENYLYLFNWDPFYTALEITFIYVIATTAIQVIIGLIAALTVANMSRFKSAVSGIFMIPYALPPIISAAMWMFLLEVNFGPVWTVLVDMLHILNQPLYWQTNGAAARGVIIAVTGWSFWPLVFILLYAARAGIPDTHYEAAEIYGAGRIKQFWNVTFPQMKSAIMVAIALRLIWNVTDASQPYMLTRGGPGYDTSILGVLLYRFAFAEQKLGIGYAVGMVLLVLTLLTSLIFIWQFQKNTETAKEAL